MLVSAAWRSTLSVAAATGGLGALPTDGKRWAGHSHWANIKHKKGANDAKRAQLYTKLSNEITAAIREGRGDTSESNHRLQSVLSKARASNMPKDRIDSALKGAQKDGAALEEVVYEASGPGNVLMVIEALTDNRKRTPQQIRTILNGKHSSGELLKPGALTSRFFNRVGLVVVKMGGQYGTEEELMERVMSVDSVDNFEPLDGGQHAEIVCQAADLFQVVAQLKERSCAVETFEHTFIAQETVAVDTEDRNDKGLSTHDILVRVLEELDDHPEVQRVTTNCSNL